MYIMLCFLYLNMVLIYDLFMDYYTAHCSTELWIRRFTEQTLLQVAQLSKFREGGGLGISLEGTVDVENGQEVRPHHYIRSVLIEGPVGANGRLKSGDELLEVCRLCRTKGMVLMI